MSSANVTIRRATVDDLGGLRLLWERARLQILDLEKHLTDFQIVVSDEGDLIGAIALQISGKQGWLHSEAFVQPEHEDGFRPLMWERVRTVARNHGLTRLWTREAAPFWHQSGFEEASRDLLQKLPAPFGDRHNLWLSLQLKEDSAASLSVEQEFELFQQQQREVTERVMRQARLFKVLAWVLIIAFMSVAGALILKMVMKTPPLG